MSKKILITAGGTGGHVFPAQGFAQKLKRDHMQKDILFVAGGLNSNRYFDRTLFPYNEVACSPIFSKNPLKLAKGAVNLIRGFLQSLKIIKNYKPDVVVGFGSYYTIPMLLAAKFTRTPIVLHEANSIPGKANKWFAPFSKSVGVHFPSTCSLFKGNAIEVGMPMREGFARSDISRETAHEYFGLDPNNFTLLIFGGSQGAKGINRLIKEIVEDGLNLNIQIIHCTGDEESAERFKSLYAQEGIKASVKAFEKQMNYAWSAANAFIGRSGASTIAEAMEFEVPGIMIPYPYAAENHQETNADFLVDTVGGGVKLIESKLTSGQLKKEIVALIHQDMIDKKRAAIRSYKKNPSRIDLCELVLNVVNNTEKK
ncbi:MAG: undecaprenyldiphospho-muramoylpentapeptide beta-N-acetylglucosaminyltransferase [Parachlamydiaceae bacterium]|nr:undecaprenyldiphospho-muramoylpentapeptide beta-N-acetylglucosaminyltransferase [Parachlamydiaceae bacterium]